MINLEILFKIFNKLMVNVKYKLIFGKVKNKMKLNIMKLNNIFNKLIFRKIFKLYFLKNKGDSDIEKYISSL